MTLDLTPETAAQLLLAVRFLDSFDRTHRAAYRDCVSVAGQLEAGLYAAAEAEPVVGERVAGKHESGSGV